jgi:hypothetical protein
MTNNRSAARVAALIASATAGGLCLCASKSNASLTIDMRATSATGSTVVLDAKHVTPGGAGDVINFEIWGLVPGHDADATNDGILSFAGSLLSSDVGTGSTHGPLLAVRDPRFTANSSSNGTQTDLDGDGDLDVGSNNDVDAASGFFIGRASTAPDPVIGNQLLIGTASLTMGQVNPLGLTNVNFRYRGSVNGDQSIASWLEDGQWHFHFGAGDYHVGAPVMIGVPEPAGIATVMAGALVATRFRRRHGRCDSRDQVSTSDS